MADILLLGRQVKNWMPTFSTDTSKVAVRYQPSEFNPAVKTRLYSTNVESIAIRDNPAANVTNQKATFVEGLIYDGIVSLNWIGKKITIDVKNSQLIIN